MDIINSFLPTLEHIGMFGYWIALFASLAEALPLIGTILPGSIIVMFLGFLSSQGYLDFGDLIFFVAIGAILGDSISYYLGTKGTKLFRAENKILKLSHLEKGEQFFKKHGSKSILLGRFLSPLRPIVPFIAGLSKMNKWSFFIWNIISAFLWALAYLLLGYFFGGVIQAVEVWSTRAGLFLLILFGFFVVLWFLIKKGRAFFTFIKSVALSVKEAVVTNSDVQRLIKKHHTFFEFIKRRFNGEKFSGLTLTLLFVAFIYVLSLFLGIIGDVITSDVIVAADMRVANLLFAFRDAELVKFFTWVTLLGKWQIVISAAFIFSIILWLWRKRTYILPLWIALAGSELFNALGKIILHRARPNVSLYVEGTYSFPSGHATIAIAFYGFVAYVLFRQIREWKYKANILFLCLLTILAIGLSRLYLGEHFLSDVWAGYLLGTLWLLIGITISEWLWRRRSSLSYIPIKGVKIISLLLILVELIFYTGFALQYHPPITVQKMPSTITTNDVMRLFLDGRLSPFTETIIADKQEPLSFIIVAKNDEVFIDAMKKAGWLRADNVTLASVVRLVQFAILNGNYSTAPMTPSFWNTKVHDFGFEKPTNAQSVRERHHARFWRTGFVTEDGAQVYVGTVSQDIGIKWFITHQIKPDIDTERELILSDLQAAKVVMSFEKEQIVEPVLGKNFSGDQFFTDGKAYSLVLK